MELPPSKSGPHNLITGGWISDNDLKSYSTTFLKVKEYIDNLENLTTILQPSDSNHTENSLFIDNTKITDDTIALLNQYKAMIGDNDSSNGYDIMVKKFFKDYNNSVQHGGNNEGHTGFIVEPRKDKRIEKQKKQELYKSVIKYTKKFNNIQNYSIPPKFINSFIELGNFYNLLNKITQGFSNDMPLNSQNRIKLDHLYNIVKNYAYVKDVYMIETKYEYVGIEAQYHNPLDIIQISCLKELNKMLKNLKTLEDSQYLFSINIENKVHLNYKVIIEEINKLYEKYEKLKKNRYYNSYSQFMKIPSADKRYNNLSFVPELLTDSNVIAIGGAISTLTWLYDKCKTRITARKAERKPLILNQIISDLEKCRGFKELKTNDNKCKEILENLPLLINEYIFDNQPQQLVVDPPPFDITANIKIDNYARLGGLQHLLNGLINYASGAPLQQNSNDRDTLIANIIVALNRLRNWIISNTGDPVHHNILQALNTDLNSCKKQLDDLDDLSGLNGVPKHVVDENYFNTAIHAATFDEANDVNLRTIYKIISSKLTDAQLLKFNILTNQYEPILNDQDIATLEGIEKQLKTWAQDNMQNVYKYTTNNLKFNYESRMLLAKHLNKVRQFCETLKKLYEKLNIVKVYVDVINIADYVEPSDNNITKYGIVMMWEAFSEFCIHRGYIRDVDNVYQAVPLDNSVEIIKLISFLANIYKDIYTGKVYKITNNHKKQFADIFNKILELIQAPLKAEAINGIDYTNLLDANAIQPNSINKAVNYLIHVFTAFKPTLIKLENNIYVAADDDPQYDACVLTYKSFIDNLRDLMNPDTTATAIASCLTDLYKMVVQLRTYTRVNEYTMLKHWLTCSETFNIDDVNLVDLNNFNDELLKIGVFSMHMYLSNRFKEQYNITKNGDIYLPPAVPPAGGPPPPAAPPARPPPPAVPPPLLVDRFNNNTDNLQDYEEYKEKQRNKHKKPLAVDWESMVDQERPVIRAIRSLGSKEPEKLYAFINRGAFIATKNAKYDTKSPERHAQNTRELVGVPSDASAKQTTAAYIAWAKKTKQDYVSLSDIQGFTGGYTLPAPKSGRH